MKKIFILVFLSLVCYSQAQTRASRSKEEAFQFTDSLRNSVLKGSSFNVLAALYSEDPGSAKQGGQLPTVIRGQMVPEFENVAYKLKVGEISEIFETKYGYHFMQLMGKEGEALLVRHILIGYK